MYAAKTAVSRYSGLDIFPLGGIYDITHMLITEYQENLDDDVIAIRKASPSITPSTFK